MRTFLNLAVLAVTLICALGVAELVAYGLETLMMAWSYYDR